MNIKNYFIWLSLFSLSSFAQTINPAHVINLCSSQEIQGSAPMTNIYNNLKTPCSTQSLSTAVTLYYVEIESGSTFTFQILPEANVDFDFASWKNPNFSNLGIGDRGSQNTIVGSNIIDIGLSMNEPTEVCETPGSSPPNTGMVHGMVRYYDVQPGDGILIAVDHWESSTIGYNLSFGGDAILSCSIVETDYEVCDEDTDGLHTFNLTQIASDLNNNNNTFIIDFFENAADANNVNSTNTLPTSYVVTTAQSPKIIYARFKRQNGLLARVSDVTLTVNKVAKVPIQSPTIRGCNPNSEGLVSFDITTLENVIQSANQNNVTFKYYTNINDAQNNTQNNLIPNPLAYLSTTATIYMQLTINDKCPVVVPIKLVVSMLNFEVKEIAISEFCAAANETSLTYDLTKSFDYLTDNDANNHKITIHNTLNEASFGSNAITNGSTYNLAYGNTKTLFVRIENKEGCYIISKLHLKSKERFIHEDIYNKICDPFILNPLPEGYRYFTEPNGKGVQLDPYSPLGIVYGKRTIYIFGNRSYIDETTPEFNNCSYDTAFTVYNNDCLIPRGISPNGDGNNDFLDLTPFGVTKLSIYNRLGTLVYEHNNIYTNQWNGTNTNGDLLPSGTYFISFESINGPKTGWVQLINEIK